MRVLFLLTLALASIACNKKTTATPQSMKSNASFDNTRWKLLKLAEMGTLPRLEKDVYVRFDKEKARLNGQSGCNTINGPYSLDGNLLKIGPLISTKMMCPTTEMQIESEFTKALTAADNILISGDKLQLRQGSVVLAELEALYLR